MRKTKESQKHPRKKWGDSTSRVIAAIQSGHRSLRSIADTTGICYRSVNGLIASLENQQRIAAEDYSVKRCNQLFRVVHAQRLGNGQDGFTRASRRKQAKLAIQQFFGMSLPANPHAYSPDRIFVHQLFAK